ncbi:MAG TPA: hypothetical protein P5525_13870 [Candidatus Paceibacterota bacterium]|nr:hypothetical protein [Candidatus Paceibacterota bacterium]
MKQTTVKMIPITSNAIHTPSMCSGLDQNELLPLQLSTRPFVTASNMLT